MFPFFCHQHEGPWESNLHSRWPLRQLPEASAASPYLVLTIYFLRVSISQGRHWLPCLPFPHHLGRWGEVLAKASHWSHPDTCLMLGSFWVYHICPRNRENALQYLIPPVQWRKAFKITIYLSLILGASRWFCSFSIFRKEKLTFLCHQKTWFK